MVSSYTIDPIKRQQKALFSVDGVAFLYKP